MKIWEFILNYYSKTYLDYNYSYKNHASLCQETNKFKFNKKYTLKKIIFQERKSERYKRLISDANY